MGNGNTRPLKGRKECQTGTGELVAGRSKTQTLTSAPHNASNGQQAPGQTAITTIANDSDDRNNSTRYTDKSCLLAPSSGFLPPAVPPPLSTDREDKNKNIKEPVLAQTFHIFFSASLKRSLLSSGKKKYGGGYPADCIADNHQTKKSAAVELTASSVSSTKTRPLQEQKHLVYCPSTVGTKDREVGNKAARVSTTNPEKRRWEVSKGNDQGAPSSLEKRIGGGTVAFVKTTIDTKTQESPEGRRRCRGRARPSAVGIFRGSVPRAQEPAERKEEGRRIRRRDLSDALSSKQSQEQQQGGRPQNPSCSVVRAGCSSGTGGLPIVKCWEGTAALVQGVGGGAGGGGGEEEQKHRGRPARSRSHFGSGSRGTQRAGDAKIAPNAIADSNKTRERMEAGSAGVSAVGRDGRGLGFGRESCDATRHRNNGRGPTRVARCGNDGFPAAAALDDHRKQVVNASSSSSSFPTPSMLQYSVAPPAEDTGGCDLEESLSVCSSLPPMGGTGTGTATVATELIFEESSFEDSGASVSQASSTERNGNDALGGGGIVRGDANGEGAGGVSARGNRGGIGHASRQRSGFSSNDFVRTRSAGRGLSNLMARIREQEASGENTQESPQRLLSTDLPSRSTAGEVLQVQEMSDSDNDGIEPLVATTPLSSFAAASAVMNAGHERAALELRNLALEREVEQLKAQLKSMGGEVVITSDRHLHGMRRPRPRAQNRVGERALLHRSSVHSSLCEATSSFSHRSGGDSISRRGVGNGDVSAGGKVHAEGGRRAGERDLAAAYKRRNPSVAAFDAAPASDAGHRMKRNVTCEADGGSLATVTNGGGSGVRIVPNVQPAPSPPRKRGSLRVLASTTAANEPPGSSPVRKLRTTRLRSPVSRSVAPTSLGASPSQGRRGCREKAQSLGDGDDRNGFVDAKRETTTNKNLRDMKDEESYRQDLGQPPGREPPGGVAEARPLPRLRMEEGERQHSLPSKKTRVVKAPINLGGVVSEIKHSLLSRRRNPVERNPQLAPPGGNYTTPTSTVARGSRGSDSNSIDKGRAETPSPVLAGEDCTSSTTQSSTLSAPAPGPAPAPAPAATLKTSEQAEERKQSTRSPARGGGNSPSSSSVPSSTSKTDHTSAVAADENERQHEGGSSEGLGEKEGRTNREGGTEAEALNTKQEAPTDDATGMVRAAEFSSEPVEAGEVARAAQVLAGVASQPAKAEPSGCKAGNAVTANNSPRRRWPATLDAQWAEVEFMLCHEIDCEESLQYTIQATEKGLVFMDKLEEKAQELGVLKGQLSRWLLPFNADTCVEEQQAATPRRFQEALLASAAASGVPGGGGSGVLSEDEAVYLTAGARRVRQLIRLKIADDNDLNTAKEALVTMASFFASISDEAVKRGGGTTPFSILQERRATSPITRPPPLPSIPRPFTGKPPSATRANSNKHDVPTLAATASRQAVARKTSDSVGRGEQSLAISTTKSSGDVAVSQDRVLEAEHRKGEYSSKNRGNSRGSSEASPRPSIETCENLEDSDIHAPQASATKVTTSSYPIGSRVQVDTAAATGTSAASTFLDTGEKSERKEEAASAACSEENTTTTTAPVTAARAAAVVVGDFEIPGLLSGAAVDGPRREQFDANTRKSSSSVGDNIQDRGSSKMRGSEPTSATAVPAAPRGGDDALAPSSSSSSSSLSPSLTESSPRCGEGVGAASHRQQTTVAPAESLVRLKRKKKQGRNRSGSQR